MVWSTSPRSPSPSNHTRINPNQSKSIPTPNLFCRRARISYFKSKTIPNPKDTKTENDAEVNFYPLEWQTYYFDKKQQLQRIAFRGTTGDPQRIITMMQHTFRLTKRPTPLNGLYIKSQNRRPVSVLMITRSLEAAKHTDATRYSQYTIQFELNRPSIGTQLSDHYKNILAAK